MSKTNSLEDPALDALADRVMDAFAVFNAQLDKRRQRFPVAEFDGLWEAVLAYSTAMQNLKWLHRNVARELSGLREYLELEIFKTPSDAIWKADQMECFLFSGYDAYPEHGKPPGLEKCPDEKAVAFAGYEAECAGCEQFLIVNELGVCEDCSQKLERDLVRNRDWAHSAIAYGASVEQREDMRKQIVDTYGEALELIAPSLRAKSNRTRRKRKSRK